LGFVWRKGFASFSHKVIKASAQEQFNPSFSHFESSGTVVVMDKINDFGDMFSRMIEVNDT